MELRKQAIGIDISKDTFTACLGSQRQDGELFFTASRSFKNTKTGYNQLLRWVRPVLDKQTSVVFLMEATGGYYQNMAYHLHGVGKVVHVVLANTSTHYAKSLNVKTKTDAMDAKILAQFALERTHRVWAPPSKLLNELRNLTRYCVQLQEQRTSLNNMVHSKVSAHGVPSFIVNSNKQLVRSLDRQIERTRQQIEVLIASDSTLSERVDQLASIKGVGRLTVATILAETNGFESFANVRQLVSYAGYDVVQRESGSSVKGKTRISKKGNRYIRNALYFPAMVACRFNPELKAFYERVIRNKPSKMIGQVAVQRKLLVLMYSLHKHGTTYQANYKKVAPTNTVEAMLDHC